MSDIHSPARSAISKQKRLDRSCVLCHQRKIRCDKKSTCENCRRADVLCYYPEPEQAVRRPQKTTIADVSARLARLERTISALSKDSPIKQDSASPEPRAFDFNSIEAKPTAIESPHSNEKLIQGNGSSRYFNEGLLSRIIEEEKEIHSLIGLQIDGTPLNEQSAAVDIEPLLSSFHRPISANEFHYPSRRCAVQLWQTYINSVDPLMKILHIPTTQRIIYAAINSSVPMDSDTNSLLLAIYFAGTATLSNHNAINLLGQEKNVALNNFKRGLEQSLAMSNFLDAPTFISLQAITIYTRCLRIYNGGRALWAFNGLILRSAQSVGLHRDGKNFNLSPFECEMRRRLWWYIVSNDSRVAEDHGFAVFNFDAAADTALPLNIDDSQLDPSMKELPAVEPKWSDMTFTLIIIEANNALLGLYHQAIRSNQNSVSEETRKETFRTLRAHFEQNYLQHCDQNIPVQRATWLIGQVLSRKLDFKSRLPWPKPSFAVSSPQSAFSSSNLTSQATEETLLEACEILELNEGFSSDDMLEEFQWIFQTYPQYDILMYILWYLCIKPDGPNVDRAWTLVDACFGMKSVHKEGWKWTVLRKLREKAINARVPSKARPEAGVLVNSTGGEALDMGLGDDLAAGVDGGLPLNMNWIPDQFDLDWSTMVENVGMQNYEF